MFKIITLSSILLFLFSCTESYVENKKLHSSQGQQNSQVDSRNNQYNNGSSNSITLVPVDNSSLSSLENNTNPSEDELTISLSFTKEIEIDCSLDSAKIFISLQNASNDVEACWDVVFDVPVGYDHHGEVKDCSQPNAMFTKLNTVTDGSWIYDSNKKSWNYKNGFMPANIWIPGFFRVWHRDTDGSQVISSWFQLKRRNYPTCWKQTLPAGSNQTSTTTTNNKTYHWESVEMFIIGGNEPPKITCNASIVNQIRTNISGTEYRCVYN